MLPRERAAMMFSRFRLQARRLTVTAGQSPACHDSMPSKRLSEQGEDGKVVESKTYEKADLIASAGAFSDSEFEKEAGKHTWSQSGRDQV